MSSALTAASACVVLSCGLISPVFADNIAFGVWLRDTGSSRLQVAPCGDKVCGVIVWVRDRNSPTKVGMKVFYDAEPTRPNVWSGKAFNPEDGLTYAGEMAVVDDKLTATGCVLGKLICKTVYWNRHR